MSGITQGHSLPESDFAFLRYQAAQGHDDSTEVRVKQDAFWSYCGPLLRTDSSLPTNFDDFSTATFTGSVLPRLLPFLSFINTYLSDCGMDNYMLTVRAIRPNTEFDQPRWHTDELFFADLKNRRLPGANLGLTSYFEKNQTLDNASSGTNWKICTTLLGPSTIFIPHKHQASAREVQKLAQNAASTQHECLSIRCVGCATAATAVREELAVKLAQFGVEQAFPGECAFFQVGRDSGAVHSEPSMSSDLRGRIFINVVPGTEEELKALMGKWGMQYPRQWWVGNRMNLAK
ncbi:hypothetical protein B0I35DRAFT_359417 [Stachybotrys elegans]|uniref:Uncharacterized protein n=1 Tax=Stachybotrys elegans TaxID=80388 RepID=A0A8K0WM24_9HYPO|nr:hypothetical protein B0I35DRAFT_359417 [Stachybotrys elegans]